MAHARGVLRAYYRAQTTCLAKPATTPITCFDTVAISTELTNMRNTLVSEQAAQTSVSGQVDLISVNPTSVDLAIDLTRTPPTVPVVVFRVCADVSGYGIWDKDGKSIVPATRPPHVLVDVTVGNYKYPDQTQWRVGEVLEVRGGSC